MAYGHIAYVGEGTTAFTMTNKTVIMTIDNIVLICGNIKNVICNAGDTLFTLPDASLFPADTILIPVYTVNEGTNAKAVYSLQINTDGTITSPSASAALRTYFTNGLAFSVNDRYYSAAIGNNDMSQMTYPLNRL